jgi:arylsulfatase A-like enzyme/Tfp pilus assembly protein PilF
MKSVKLFVSIIFSLICGSAFAAKPNVLLISIDTLRADRLGCYGYSKRTPAIDSLAAKSALFENTISQVPLTLPSHCTIFTGLYPDQHGVRNNENFKLDSKHVTLAELFRQNGYSTGAVIGSFSLDSSFGPNQGFQFYEDKIGTGHDPETNRHVERRGDAVWKLGKKWLEEQEGPWFCFLHFFDPHFGYNPPKPHSQDYDGEVAYIDTVVGQIVQFLQQAKYSTTIVVLLSDHGEALGEHGEDNHGVFLYDSTMKVPLMISAPGIAPRRIKQQVRLVDVAPTISELAGLAKKPKFSGVSLMPHLNGTGKELPAFSESYYTNLLMGWAPLHSVRFNQRKWIDAPKSEFYDLTKDPQEIKNLYTSSSIVPPTFRSELQKRRSTKPSAPQNIDAETREKLASLGYVTGSTGSANVSGLDPKDGIGVWTTIESAVRHAQMSQWAESETLLRDVLKKQPDNVIAKKFLANVLRKQGKNNEAIPYLEDAMKSELHTEETLVDLAETYFDIKKYKESLDLLQPLLRKPSTNARVLSLGAWLFAHFKQDQESIDAYDQLAALRPLREEEAIRAAGVSLSTMDKIRAEKYFMLALEANRKSTIAWKGLGLILASKSQWNDAMDAFLNAGDCNEAKNMITKINSIPSDLMSRFQEKCH